VDQQEISTEEVVRKAQAGQPLEDPTPALQLLIRGKPLVTFDHLCPPCVAIVGAHIDRKHKTPTQEAIAKGPGVTQDASKPAKALAAKVA
jgi:hypothetical protein